MPQGSVHWQGTQRRACAPGAHWNVQVVRGKVTTQCLWHACKALGIGLLLMLLGACMATVGFLLARLFSGYYADQLSVAQEIRGNLTVKVKNESRGFHLNNLSYAGPIVMGVGGFIVVAACVMTFEARDSAAKVVPARFRFNQASTTTKHVRNQRNRKSTSSQTTKWDHQLGVFRANRSPSPSAQHDISRKQLTAEFVRFSKDLRDKGVARSIKKSPSAPTLIDKRSPRRTKAPKYSGCALLNPELLQRHALSVDNPTYNPHRTSSRESLEQQKLGGSQASMAMDLYIPDKGPVTLKVKDRSDTAKRHQLLRQTKVEDVEEIEETRRPAVPTHIRSPKLPGDVLGVYSRYPDDFVPRKRNSIDSKLLEEFSAVVKDQSKTSPRDFRKISSPNFRKMSFDRIGGERKFERSSMTMGHRKASLEFRSPDFRRGDYRKLSVDRFSVDRLKCLTDETVVVVGSRAISGEYLPRRQQQQRHPKLHHSRSDDDRRRSFDRWWYPRDSRQSSRHSLNTMAHVVVEGLGRIDPESKYFTTQTGTAGTSLDTEESRAADNSDDSHAATLDIEDLPTPTGTGLSSEAPTEVDALLEEPEELEINDLTEINVQDTGHTGDIRNVQSVGQEIALQCEEIKNIESTIVQMDEDLSRSEDRLDVL